MIQNVLPRPSSLDAPADPPISSAICRAIANPNPDPPYRLVVELSACENGSNSRPSAIALMPMPVSVTVKRSITPPSLAA